MSIADGVGDILAVIGVGAVTGLLICILAAIPDMRRWYFHLRNDREKRWLRHIEGTVLVTELCRMCLRHVPNRSLTCPMERKTFLTSLCQAPPDELPKIPSMWYSPHRLGYYRKVKGVRS